MQITVHLLSTDTEYGNSVRAFATEADLIAAQAEIMRERGPRHFAPDQRDAFLTRIDTDFAGAWEQFTELESYNCDYYATDEETITLPDPAPPAAPILITVEGGLVQAIDNLPPGLSVEVRDWDAECDPTEGGTVVPDPERWYQDPEQGDWARRAVWQG